MTRTSVLAGGVAGIAVAVYGAFGIIYLTPVTPWEVYQQSGYVTTVLFVLPFTGFALVGGLLSARRPRNPVGWWLLSGSLLLGLGALCDIIGSDLVNGGSAAGPWIALGGVLWGGTGISVATASLLTALLLFPDGTLLSRRWRLVIALTWTLAIAFSVFYVIDSAPGALGIGYSSDPRVNATSPLAVAGTASWQNTAQTLANLSNVLSVAAFISVFLRLRGADGERRQQIKWFGTGAAITVVAEALPNFSPVNFSASPLLLSAVGACAVIGGFALPICAAVAIFKYRLYDIDVIISRTLVYGALAAFITAVYVAIVVGIGSVIGAGADPNLGLSILATAIVAAGFQPLRERVQRIANRLVYGKRATPYQVLSSFSSQLAATHAAEEVLPRMAQALLDGTGAEEAVVWLRGGDELRPVAIAPSDAAAPAAAHLDDQPVPAIPGMNLVVPVNHGAEPLGALSLRKRRSEPFTPAETRLTNDLAGQAGLVLKNVGLTDELLRRRDELQASRRRLVSAQDDERRRLERNLHDGAQQYLVAIKVKLSLAAALARRDPGKARAAVQDLKGDADEALETLRDLARGIYPPLLADRGLVSALEAQARRASIGVSVEAGTISRHSQAVEATAYFCCLEALQNCQKYAGAARATIRISEADNQLTFEVRDDGAGFDPATVQRGAGLNNMADRIDALGGELEVRSAPGVGTTVRGVLPIEVAAAA